MANTTTVVPPSLTFATGSGGALTAVQGPGELPVLTDAAANAYMSQEFIVPAAGEVINPPTIQGHAQTSVSRYTQITNVDSTGYVALTLYSTSTGPVAVLAPNGGTFAISSTGVLVAGSEFVFDPGALQLRTCDSAGVLANGVATRVRITCTALVTPSA